MIEMKKNVVQFWSLLSMICLGLVLLFSCSDDATGPDDETACKFDGPRLEIPDTAFDFGFVPQYSKISHTFTLRSIGCDTLLIDKVLPG